MAKKRANGEGSIRKKPNGRWEGIFTVDVDPNTGRASQKSISAKTQAECKEKLRRLFRNCRRSGNGSWIRGTVSSRWRSSTKSDGRSGSI